MKTYFRLLSFAKPIEKYAIPYIICTVVAVVFGTLNLALLAPLLQVLFKGTDSSLAGSEVAVTKRESGFDLAEWFTYYADFMYLQTGTYNALKYVSISIITSVIIS